MTTITEDYVSFEIAKLLKEKGFDGQYHMYYVEDGKYICDDLHDIKDYAKSVVQLDYLNKTKVPAPTLQMVIKWLREAHNIDVSIIPLRSHKEYLPRVESDILDYDVIPCRKYEEACEIAIKYCLENLI